MDQESTETRVGTIASTLEVNLHQEDGRCVVTCRHPEWGSEQTSFETNEIDESWRYVESFVHPYADSRAFALARLFPNAPVGLVVDSERRQDILRNVGANLFGLIFRDRTLRLFDRALDGLDDQSSLRIRLIFNVDGAPKGKSLLALPWELLYHSSREFLASSWRYPLVRELEVDRRKTALEFGSPLRVLLVSAEPDGLGKLDLDSETSRLRNSLARQFAIEPHVLPHATKQELRKALNKGFDIVLFSGHGDFNGSEGQLYLETRTGGADPVSASELRRFFRDAPQTQLIVLSACKGATVGADNADSFRSVATALCASGQPAVLAMQHTVYNSAVEVFSTSLFSSLAQGYPLEVAVARARGELLDHRDETAEWMVPVLYLRSTSEDFRLKFDIEKAEPAAVGLRLFSMLHSLDPEPESGDDLLDLRPHFEDLRFVRDGSSWTNIGRQCLSFVRNHAVGALRVLVDGRMHTSIAYLVGSILDRKSGVRSRFLQHSGGGIDAWDTEATIPENPRLWQATEPETLGDSTPGEIAVAVTVMKPTILDDVRGYLEHGRQEVGTLIEFRLQLDPSTPTDRTIKDGGHARALADAFRQRIDELRGQFPTKRLHLFLNVPIGLAFLFGRLQQGLGPVQLYEFDFDKLRHGTYEPSLAFPISK